MNKRLLAVAVAGALAAPTAAFAQSSVTISGIFKGGFENSKIGSPAAARAGLRTSQYGVVDDSSRLIFNVVEDLGGGLQAIGQFDMRMKLDDAQGAASTGSNLAQGNTHVGLRSKQWGRLFLGRQDLHYFNRESDLTTRGSLRADSISILAYAGTGLQSIAGATRTQNVVHYTTPNWGGFTVIAAYSSNPSATDADIGTSVRRGRAWNLNPNYQAANWQVGYSYWSAKPDGGAGAAAAAFVAAPSIATLTAVLAASDQRGDRFYGSYTWGGLKFGLAWDRSKLKATGPAGSAEISKRTAWSFPISYTWGAHSIHAHFDKAKKDKTLSSLGINDTGASMFALSYAYDLSKRTSAAVTYARIKNSTNASYNFFTGGTLGVSPAINAGEDPKLWGVTLRHQF